jgi:hypothetical protein
VNQAQERRDRLTNLPLRNPKEEHWEDLGVDGRIIQPLKFISEIGWKGVHWTYLPQDRNQPLPFTNKVMNLQAP